MDMTKYEYIDEKSEMIKVDIGTTHAFKNKNNRIRTTSLDFS